MRAFSKCGDRGKCKANAISAAAATLVAVISGLDNFMKMRLLLDYRKAVHTRHAGRGIFVLVIFLFVV